MRYREQYRRCGKANCRRCAEGPGHYTAAAANFVLNTLGEDCDDATAARVHNLYGRVACASIVGQE